MKDFFREREIAYTPHCTMSDAQSVLFYKALTMPTTHAMSILQGTSDGLFTHQITPATFSTTKDIQLSLIL